MIQTQSYLDVDRHTHHGGYGLAQLFNILTLLADNDAGAGCVDSDFRRL